MPCAVSADLVSVTAEEIGVSMVWADGSASLSETLSTMHSELVGVDGWNGFPFLVGWTGCS